MTKHIFLASTPAATRDEIVKWLKWQASNHRLKLNNAIRVSSRKEEAAIAGAYQEAADYIERCN